MRRILPLALAACAAAGDDAPVDDTEPADTDVADTDPVDTEVPDTDPDTDEAPSACRASPAELTVHLDYAEGGAVALVEDASVVVEKGNPSQGFPFHLPLAVALANTDEVVKLRYRVVDVATERTLFQDGWLEYAVALVPAAGIGTAWACDGVYPAVNVPVDPTILVDEPDPAWAPLCGRPVRVEVEAQDFTTDAVLDAVSVEAFLQPAPVDGEPCEAPAAG